MSHLLSRGIIFFGEANERSGEIAGPFVQNYSLSWIFIFLCDGKGGYAQAMSIRKIARK